MAHYLPVLLVSVTNPTIVPDDSAVSTQPRGQVDYLSHEWREEDVWRSWRNMTKQKNEIANGMRLENASWRTWWKQRNKLKTVTPETLNWLKDSDVTWLYGPLHTAVDWSPPPKPSSVVSEVGKDNPAQDRLDLSVPTKRPQPPVNHTKSILKHRSISQLLTADLASPAFSPAESEEEEDESSDIVHDEIQTSFLQLPRPPLVHTKSDSHILKANKPFRKDSPPRIAPPGSVTAETAVEQPEPSRRPRGLTPSNSRTNLHGYFASGGKSPTSSTISSLHTRHPKRIEETSPMSAASKGTKKRICFNTFVEQCIAIDKPQKRPRGYSRYYDGEWYDDDDEEIRERTGAGHVWHRSRALESDSDSDYGHSPFQDEDSGDDGIIEMKSPTSTTISFADQEHEGPSSSPSPAMLAPDLPPSDVQLPSPETLSPPLSSPSSPEIRGSRRRSKSKASNTSSSSASTTSSSNGMSSSSTTYRPRTRSGTVIRAPGSMLKTSSLGEREPVTIAPIAPTMLKTGEPLEPTWSDGEDEYEHADDGWSERVSAGFNSWYQPDQNGRSRNSRRPSNGDSEKAVELVYVPPTWRGYDVNEEEDSDIEDSDDDDRVYHHSTLNGVNHAVPSVGITPPSPSKKGTSVPLQTPYVANGTDVSSFFEGPDMGEDYDTRPGRRRYKSTDEEEAGVGEERVLSFGAELRRYPSHGDRHEATIVTRRGGILDESPSSSPPKPASLVSQSIPLSVPVSRGRQAHDSSPGTSSVLLSAPLRGRSSSSTSLDSQSPPQSQTRGRSSTRTSSSLSDRERSSHSSSLGSLSPEGVGTSASAYASGRQTRGRTRSSTSRSLSQSLSPDDREGIKVLQSDARIPSPIIEASNEQVDKVRPKTRSSPPNSTSPSTSLAKPAPNGVQRHRNGDDRENDSLMGRVVSSAGAYFGFWNGHTPNPPA